MESESLFTRRAVTRVRHDGRAIPDRFDRVIEHHTPASLGDKFNLQLIIMSTYMTVIYELLTSLLVINAAIDVNHA